MNIKEILEQHKIWIVSFGREGIKADLRNANLSDVDFSDANLSDANLNGANLNGANLIGANLSDASLRGADLRGADFNDANLRNADLSDTDLRGADLSGADLHGADLPESTFIILGEPYFISIANGDYVRAGCQCHLAENWRQFSKKRITQMDGKKALQFYPRLLDIIDFYCGKGERPDWLKEREKNNG